MSDAMDEKSSNKGLARTYLTAGSIAKYIRLKTAYRIPRA